MIAGIAGTLLSHDAIAHVLPIALRGLLDETGAETARQRLRAWHLPLRSELGPATSARVCFDRLAAPLLAQMGYRVLASGGAERSISAVLQTGGATRAVAVVTAWGADPGAAWRDCVHHGIAHNVRWCLCLTGPVLRVVDARRTYSRQHVEFDLVDAFDRRAAFAPFWGLLRADAMRTGGTHALLDRAIAISERYRGQVRDALQHGVRDALLQLVQAFRSAARRSRRGRASGAEGTALEESLVVIYRVLFLLFAEARGMVPRWHPIYRHAYSIEALRDPIEHLPRPAGLWETLQAITRLAHAGCRVGALHVTPFNGRLFSPVHSPLADSLRLDDAPVRGAMLALTTRETKGGRQRIAYDDLGVEHLGGVYERLLDFDIEVGATRRPRFVPSEERKATGSFYTPRSLTEFLVRRTLAPLVQGVSADRVLKLRVLDPAMGSGAFLVAACRYLAAAYEAALIHSGEALPGEVGEAERAQFRRLVAQRCLYGVDVNPMAVQLARLSLWLATLSADRPLTFLDHRLRAGNSLLGASLADVARERPSGGRRTRGRQVLPLFAEDDEAYRALRRAVEVRTAIAVEPGDTLEQVRGKERALAALAVDPAGTRRWKSVADLWCAGWFGDHGSRRARRAAFRSLVEFLTSGTAELPGRVAEPLLADARVAAERARFFHWTLEFPEVFVADEREPHRPAGFDAVIGNPPWEMLRSDRGSDEARRAARLTTAALVDFARGSGVYRLQGDGHPNLYQMFLERSLDLVRPGGRLGLLLPAGFATDRGSGPLRRGILDSTEVDTCISIENREGIFPIHRGVKFLALALTRSGRSPALPCRFGVQRAQTLDAVPDIGDPAEVVSVPRALLDRIGGDGLVIPDIRTPTDLEILRHVAFAFPALGDPAWGLRFGRELNASEDRHHFTRAPGGLPVLEGKQLAAFRADPATARFTIPPASASRLLDASRTFDRPRLAYRDVAASTNRRTLIAAMVPAGTVTTHTVFCLKEGADDLMQQYLCGMFNSFVADYLVRMRVTTHLGAGAIGRLRIPRPGGNDRRVGEVVRLARRLSALPDPAASARLQALAADLYRLTREQFLHVLSTFPLVPRGEREAAYQAFCDIVASSSSHLDPV